MLFKSENVPMLITHTQQVAKATLAVGAYQHFSGSRHECFEWWTRFRRALKQPRQRLICVRKPMVSVAVPRPSTCLWKSP